MPVKVDIVAELKADDPALDRLTPELLVSALQSPQLRPMLEAVVERGRSIRLDGFVKFYLRATVSDRADQDAIIRMSLHELCDFFERKIRTIKGFKNFAVSCVAVLSPKGCRS